MSILWLWWLCNVATQVRVSSDQFSFTLVPFRQDLRGWSTSQDTGMDEAWEADMGNVSRRAEDSLKVPDRLGAVNNYY